MIIIVVVLMHPRTQTKDRVMLVEIRVTFIRSPSLYQLILKPVVRHLNKYNSVSYPHLVVKEQGNSLIG